MRFEYVLLEAFTIPVVLGFGAFLLHQSLSDPRQQWALMGGSLLLVFGVVLTVLVLRSVYRHLHSHPNQG